MTKATRLQVADSNATTVGRGKRSCIAATEPAKRDPVLRAKLAAMPAFVHAGVAHSYLSNHVGEIDLPEFMGEVRDRVKAVQSGDLAGVEAMLMAQAVSLDALFVELVRRAGANLGQHMPAVDVYLRMALKAQNQSRATLQTLGEIKNPRQVAFIKQANVAHGPQQVNNGGDAGAGAGPVQHAPAKNSGERANKLLEVNPSERLDFGASSAAGATHSKVETVEAIDRAAHGAGQAGNRQERQEARHAKRITPGRHARAPTVDN